MLTRAENAFGLETLRAEVLTRAGFLHGFSSRAGGVAGELQLGLSAGGERAAVLENRRRLLLDVFGEALPLMTVAQVHGAKTLRVARCDARAGEPKQADGLMTDEPGVALGIQTADCVPVLVADRERGTVAAFHAGWRGTVRRVVEQGIARMHAEYGTRPESLVAAIGPCIGECCYTVGAEVRQEFEAAFGYGAELFVQGEEGAGMRLDLKEANRRQLLEAGLEEGEIEVMPECTACGVGRFFSYRAEAGKTGRMMAVIAARAGSRVGR